MSGKIFKYDPYMLRQFQDKDVDLFIDIGANKGTTSVMARVLFPFAKIMAFEPHNETFDILCTQAKPWGIHCYREAIGNGDEVWFKPGKFSGVHRFVDKKTFDNSRIKHDADKRTYPMESLLLSSLFKKYKIKYEKLNYIIKMDCEGCEGSLLKDVEAFDIISNAMLFTAEIHFGISSATSEIWECWFKIFEETHTLYELIWVKKGEEYFQEHILCEEFPIKGRSPQLSLVKKVN